MMLTKHVRQFLALFLLMLGMTQTASAFKDIKIDLTGDLLTAEEKNADTHPNVQFGVVIGADGTQTRVPYDDESADIRLSGRYWNDHGWVDFKGIVKVDGAVKIGIGNCQYGSGTVKVQDAEGNEVLAFDVPGEKKCWKAGDESTITYGYYKGGATTLTINGATYQPYISVEPISELDLPSDAVVSFALGSSGAEGVLPAGKKLEIGKKFTIPYNRTLYVEGKTLTAWTDGSSNYVPGSEITVKEDIELTPVFTGNNVKFEDRTGQVTAVWDFQQKNGAPVVAFEGTKGIWVAQAIVNGQTIDMKMDFDTTKGKIANANWQDWAQLNNGTVLTIPSAKGTAVSLEAYGDITTTTIDGKTDYEHGKTITSTIAGDAETIDIVIGDGSYYRTVTAVYPKAKEGVAATWKDIQLNLVGPLLKAEERTEGVQLNFGVAIADDGTQTRVSADDVAANIVVSGVFHDDAHGWTKTTATVKVDGPVKIGIGNCQYGSADVSVKNAEGQEVLTFTVPAEKNCYHQNPASNVTYATYDGGATTLTIYNATYMPFISVEAIQTGVENATVNATFPFNLGTEDQVADFGDLSEFFLSSKVVVGSNINYYGARAHGDYTLTQVNPTEQQSAADASNAIKFIIRPYPGLVFTPTKVKFAANRWGTDGGKLDAAWVNPDGTTVSLMEGQTPKRNNDSGPSEYSFDITGAKAAEGECGLQLNLYSLAANKQYGFSSIVIEGTLNGEKQEIPILTSFVANGVTHVAEKEFEIQGDNYVANIELFSTDNMVNAGNPVSDIVVKAGELGTVTYEGDDQKTTVTIPVTHNNITMNWVANFVRKPFYTLTFIDTDAQTVLGTQQVEKDAKVGSFSIDESKITVSEGNKFRGWATAVAGSTAVKYSAESTFQENTNLYAYTTPIELATPTARYDYDLTSPNFDPADHEMISVEGSGYYYNTHGWVFSGGDKVKLTLAGKGYIKMGLCLYSNTGNIVVTDPKGQEIASFSARGNADGASTTVEYEGEAGELTITFPAGGATYMHNFSIRNLAENPYTHADGSNVYVVKRGATDTESGSNLLSMLELANGLQGSDRAVIFLPNGTYDLGETVLTAISRNNISIVGQSMEGTIIKNAPDKSIEGIGTTATLVNTSTGLYLQDLTLQNALDYYGAVGGGQVGGRAVCLWDKGKQTISKNVRMLSYQDTYYSNSNSQFYWETSEIHGTVDYLCGGGDVYYNEVLFVNESRALNGKSGSDVVAAPYTDSSCKFGYVFNNCTIENLAASFSLGRSWGGQSKLTYLNTTINQPSEVIDTRFTVGGMNIAAYSFKEYHSTDPSGNVVSPASNVQTFTHSNGNYTYETILSAAEAAEYTLDKVFANWKPADLTVQATAPAANYANGTITWNAVDGVNSYALFKNGQFVAIAEGTSYVAEGADKEAWTIRSANGMGGYGPAATVVGTVDAIRAIGIEDDAASQVIYNLQGQRVQQAAKGLYIVNGKKVVKK